jgi:hypothetical protein
VTDTFHSPAMARRTRPCSSTRLAGTKRVHQVVNSA